MVTFENLDWKKVIFKLIVTNESFEMILKINNDNIYKI